MPDNKTTQEEIDKKAKEALEAKETPDDETPEGEDTETPEEEETETPTDEGKEDEETPEGEGEDEGDEEEGEEGDQGKKKQPPTQQPPIEDRYRESTREAQVLYKKQKKFTDTVEQAANLPEPTEEELKAEYPEWDEMTDTEKRLAKDNFVNKRKFDMVHQATLEGKKIDEWANKVDTYLTTAVTKFPRLAGKEEEFKWFCMKPKRRERDFEDLVKAFLFDATETPTRKKGSLLETGSGGRGGEREQGNFIDEKQAATLRTKNHKLYQKLVREGKIKIQL